jgi:hypothetical protein
MEWCFISNKVGIDWWNGILSVIKWTKSVKECYHIHSSCMVGHVNTSTYPVFTIFVSSVAGIYARIWIFSCQCGDTRWKGKCSFLPDTITSQKSHSGWDLRGKWLPRQSRLPEVVGSNPVSDVWFTSTFFGGLSTALRRWCEVLLRETEHCLETLCNEVDLLCL